MIAFARAQNRLGGNSLDGCILATSCEPCAMCCGAVPWSGVDKVIYGAGRSMAEQVGFDEGYKGRSWRKELEKRGIEVTGPRLGKSSFRPFALYREMSGRIY